MRLLDAGVIIESRLDVCGEMFGLRGRLTSPRPCVLLEEEEEEEEDFA